MVHPVFQWLEEPASYAAASAVTMLELLVRPYRRHDLDTVNRIYALLSTFSNLHWVDLTLPVADEAARLRAEWNLKTPDAIQAASALAAGATGNAAYDLGKLYFSASEYAKAAGAFEKALKLGGVADADDANAELGMAYARLGKKAEATKAFDA